MHTIRRSRCVNTKDEGDAQREACSIVERETKTVELIQQVSCLDYCAYFDLTLLFGCRENEG